MPQTDERKCIQFARKMEELVLADGRSKTVIFEEAGLDPNLYARWVKGSQAIKLDEAFRLARSLGSSLDYMADDDVAENPAARSQEREELDLLIDSLEATEPGLARRRLHGLGGGDWTETRSRSR